MIDKADFTFDFYHSKQNLLSFCLMTNRQWWDSIDLKNPILESVAGSGLKLFAFISRAQNSEAEHYHHAWSGRVMAEHIELR